MLAAMRQLAVKQVREFEALLDEALREFLCRQRPKVCKQTGCAITHIDTAAQLHSCTANYHLCITDRTVQNLCCSAVGC